MGELDYQMALLLQHRFDQETHSSSNSEQADREFARALQEQFQHESNIENPTNNIVYKKPTNFNSTKCLTDPSWELVDPTPDIHILFMAFNEKFFWNKLLAVCVSWSKKMTSCAGVCSYSGRGGMCSITLSEPLLKLRPRKDLVETLLHEMIHAYLFVTHNNKDRDGHGPEFHKHMYRINADAGTNITVYHDFHDEVRLYQQHWWRCNGPCQHKRPYFGMVRRATNRAPGPNDRWWDEHSRTCGGSFIKVKEPEKKTTSKKSVAKPKNMGDIRKYIPNINEDSIMPSSSINFKDVTVVNPKLNKACTSTSNIVGFKDILHTNTLNSNAIPVSKAKNIKGFKDLNNTGLKGRSNSSSTIIINKSNNKDNQTNTYKPTIINNNEETHYKPATQSDFSNDFISVRNHWANKFHDDKSKKRRSSEPAVPDTSPKVPKTASESDELVECPVCQKMFKLSLLNKHLNTCLEESEKSTKSCPICNDNVSCDNFETHVDQCLMKVCDEVEEALDNATYVEKKSADDKVEEVKVEEKSKVNEFISCLACDKEILKNDLNSHLEDCMNMSDIFKDELVLEENTDSKKEEVKKYNCPFCLNLYTEANMKGHLDMCLNVSEYLDL